jgi:hypothetical protein
MQVDRALLHTEVHRDNAGLFVQARRHPHSVEDMFLRSNVSKGTSEET